MNKTKTFKKLIALGFALLCFACSKESITTEFYVKNTSTKTISFDASVIKFSQITDPYEVFLSFTVHPDEIVLARKTGFEKDGKEPQKWFNTFVIHPVDGIQMNDPNLAENWIKSNKDGTPTYTFTLNKN